MLRVLRAVASVLLVLIATGIVDVDCLLAHLGHDHEHASHDSANPDAQRASQDRGADPQDGCADHGDGHCCHSCASHHLAILTPQGRLVGEAAGSAHVLPPARALLSSEPSNLFQPPRA